MKTFIKITLILILLTSCNENYKAIETRVVKGVVSAKDEGHVGRISTLPKFYIQSAKEIVTIDVPFVDENLFQVGDTICVVVKTVEKLK